jgi:peptidoglycan biosynthesis protein MviN/MurJ (putative lipid II flippase)
MVLACTQIAGAVVGLLRNNVLNRFYFGGGVADAYIASFRPSDFLFQITVMAGVSTVLVPMLAKYKATNDQQGMSELLSSVLWVGSLAFGAIALLASLFFPSVAPALVRFPEPQMELYIRFGQLALLTNFLFVAGNIFGQYLITVQRYWIYGLTPIFYSLGTVTGAIFLRGAFGDAAPMAGTLGGALVYVLCRLIAAMRCGFLPTKLLWHADILTMGWLMLPRMIALGALQLELLFFDRIASGMEQGMVVINANARDFQSVVVGVIGIALSQSAFSLLSQSAAMRNAARYWTYVRKGTTLLLVASIPASMVLVLAAPVAARLVHLHDVISIFWLVLSIYAVSVPLECMNHLLLRSYYAVHRTGIPASMNIVNGIVAIICSWWLAPVIGIHALAVGFTAGQLVQVLGLGALLSQAAGPFFRKREENAA